MIFGNHVAKVKLVEQLTLVTLQAAHYGSTSPRFASTQRNHGSPHPSMTFATKSATSGRMRRPLIELHRRQNGYIGSISPGRQVLLNQGSSGPYSRKRVFQPFPRIVCTQFASLPEGAFGPK